MQAVQAAAQVIADAHANRAPRKRQRGTSSGESLPSTLECLRQRRREVGSAFNGISTWLLNSVTRFISGAGEPDLTWRAADRVW